MQQKYCDHGWSQAEVEDHATDLAGAQLLRLGRKTEKGIDLPFREQFHEARAVGLVIHLMSFVGSSPTCAAMVASTDARSSPALSMPNFLPFKSPMVRMGSCANSS